MYHKDQPISIEKSKNIIEKPKNIIKVDIDEDPTLIVKTQFEYINKIKSIKNHNHILNYLNNLPIIREFNNTHTGSDNVTLIEGYIVKKKCNLNSLGNFMFWNEVNVLKKVKQFPHFPHLITYDPHSLTIYMTYCGPTLKNDNIPYNWEEQFNEISEIMNVLNVNSNDMINRNICCLGNEIKIIDFGLNTIFGRTNKEVLNDFYRDLKNISNNTSRIPKNTNNTYDYNIYYPNWKDNLKKFDIIQKKICFLKKSIGKKTLLTKVL
jgi:tRNA A-37 threonylcarbamoyl transferase component Bud32